MGKSTKYGDELGFGENATENPTYFILFWSY